MAENTKESIENPEKFLAENNNKIISFIWAEVNDMDKDTIDIFPLWTDEKYRG